MGTNIEQIRRVDQTLYWMVVNDADQADYVVGLINSARLGDTIRPFQPVGMNGPRHVHELPLAVIPRWDPAEPRHVNVVAATRQLTAELAAAVASAALQAVVATPSNVARRGILRSRAHSMRPDCARVGLVQTFPNF